jgi:hypothetical protein
MNDSLTYYTTFAIAAILKVSSRVKARFLIAKMLKVSDREAKRMVERVWNFYTIAEGGTMVGFDNGSTPYAVTGDRMMAITPEFLERCSTEQAQALSDAVEEIEAREKV